MNIKLLLKIALRNLKEHKIRSILTILGIIAGISAIIATMAIGYGAEEKLKRQILSMGKNYIFIHAGNSLNEGKTNLTRRKDPGKISNETVDILKFQCNQIDKISPTMFSRQIVSFNGTNVLCDTKAGNEDLISVMERKIEYGRSFSNTDISKTLKVVILGNRTAKELFKNKNAIGQTVKINNIFFSVIGVIISVNNYGEAFDPNLDIFMPITTLKKYIINTNDNKIHGISISSKNKQDMAPLVRKIKKILRFNHRLNENEPDDFTIYDQQAMVSAAKNSSSILNLLLLIIASISLLVGGIGVMNIMLVSVSERTKEIGIRMALGATTNLILKQFMLESVALCLVGGMAGIIIGIIIPYIISFFTNWIVIIKPITIFVAFIITFLIGLIFGLYPAKKASKLNPVEALQEV